MDSSWELLHASALLVLLALGVALAASRRAAGSARTRHETFIDARPALHRRPWTEPSAAPAVAAIVGTVVGAGAGAGAGVGVGAGAGVGADGAGACDVVLVASVSGTKHSIDVVDIPGSGRCYKLDGVQQACDRDEHKYHEVLVHLPCSTLRAAGSPNRALLLLGGDCMALREVLKYPQLESVTVLEEDEHVVSACEQHLMARPNRGGGPSEDDRRVRWIIGDVGRSLDRLSSGGNEHLQGYDLIVVDLKRRPPSSVRSTLSPQACTHLRLLLHPDGVVSCGRLLLPTPPSTAALEAAFPHSVEYSDRTGMFDVLVLARFDVAAASASPGASGEAVGRLTRDRVHARFYEPGKLWSHLVPKPIRSVSQPSHA